MRCCTPLSVLLREGGSGSTELVRSGTSVDADADDRVEFDSTGDATGDSYKDSKFFAENFRMMLPFCNFATSRRSLNFAIT